MNEKEEEEEEEEVRRGHGAACEGRRRVKVCVMSGCVRGSGERE